MRLALAATAIVVAAGLGGAYAAGAFGESKGPPGATHAPPPPDTAELATIRQLVLRAATSMGESSPTDAVLVPTTRRLAELVDVDTAEPDTPSYFVLVHGKFTDWGARIPRGGKPPTGTILTLTIDSNTNELLDSGLVGKMPDLDAMGKPETLQLTGVERGQA
jgi:hypothetical protein